MKFEWFITYNEDTLEINPSYNYGMINENELIKALKENDPSAQFVIGNYFDAIGDYRQAVYYYSLAAQQSYAPAEHYLALCYFHGDGVEKSEDLCKHWMSNAINDGDAVAAFFMGERYDEATIDEPFLTQNDRLSTFWYIIGAKMGNKKCMYNLAYNLLNGIGGEKSEIFATYWFNKAALGGLELAINWVKMNTKWDYINIKEFEKKAFTHQIIKFGNYYINNKNIKEPIEWLVCDENDEYMVLVSKNSIKVMSYTDNMLDCEWKDSKVRKFLNGEFLNEAFDNNTRKRLIPRFSQNELNPVYETESGEHPRDFVTIPDMFDLVLRLDMKEWCCIDVPASTNIIVRMKGQKYDQWWLRNRGEPGQNHRLDKHIVYNDYFYSYVDSEGKINYRGISGTSLWGVRPMIIVSKK